MQIDWKIEYDKKTANCSLMEVNIIETNRTLSQEFEEHKVAVGFEKSPSKRKFFCKITRMDGSLWEDKEILPTYGDKLGEIFDEAKWDNL